MPAITVLAVNEDQVTPGVTAFLIVAALGVTLFFLVRSMNKQISRIEAPSEEDLRQADWERRRAETGEQPEQAERAAQPTQPEGQADQSET
ncbi:hypothetical protein GCM10027176_62640 [Actinoallomurus bryophytorum]|uniref:Uncharacterized protein n=1 Tax=Actinoallomurus bryophytorum TaxID=1490222 RepID=A0A543CFP2_9ACTN|nr:hypothetical protein [Actinoallomurus bryophytorum]TQL95810.1 hypothetical protein FB559_1320 [Actinoallomurus bryophytorum]